MCIVLQTIRDWRPYNVHPGLASLGRLVSMPHVTTCRSSFILSFGLSTCFRSPEAQERLQTFSYKNDDTHQSFTMDSLQIGSSNPTIFTKQTVTDFLKSQTRIPFERSEATPIPLAVLAAWEQRILSSDSSLAEILTLGCFLVATMASLRFRDLLRTKPDSLTVQGFILRGISWRTKTSVSGQPWGVCCLGVSTRPSNCHWVSRFLEVISIGIERSRNHWGADWSPDFLLPSWTDSVPFSTPCSYHHALALIRFYSQCNWLPAPLLSPEQAKHLSTKSTLLAAAGQLNLNLEQRAKQGHHKKSVQLYSRDDVWPSLFLQRDILLEISAGWRPLTSQARGAKQPLPEPSFLAPPVSPEDLALLHMLAPKAHTEPIKPQQSEVQPLRQSKASLEESSSSSESSDSESSDEDEELFSNRPAVLVLNEKSHVIHAARVTSPESSKRSCFVTKNTKFEINCGAFANERPVFWPWTQSSNSFFGTHVPIW